MFRIRQSYREDVDQVLAVAEHLDTVNLPADRQHIEAILDRSARSFGAEVPAAEREFLFVLEDLSRQRIIGTSMIYAQHGTRRAPHIFFRVENDERYSVTLDKHFIHQTLRIGYNYDGPTEIGGLILLPEYRRTTEALGKSLSYVRFLFIRMHRPLFRDKVLSELLPPLEPDGQSKLWEALGRKFTGLTYQEADLLSKDNKEFIHALFPDDPIHTELLPDDVRTLIGQVGPETKAVEAMLRRIGFEYAGQIDPFDGGPHFAAKTDDITLVRDAREAAIRTVEGGGGGGGERAWAVLAVELVGQRPKFRATGARVTLLESGEIGVADEARRRLGVEDGQKVWLTCG
jgi:arginine N-succinyltransferase